MKHILSIIIFVLVFVIGTNSSFAINDDSGINIRQAYLKKVQKKLQSNWKQPKVGLFKKNDYDIDVRLVINRDGTIRDYSIKEKSNSKKTIKSVEDAIKISEPFDPMPSELYADYLYADLSWYREKQTSKVALGWNIFAAIWNFLTFVI